MTVLKNQIIALNKDFVMVEWGIYMGIWNVVLMVK